MTVKPPRCSSPTCTSRRSGRPRVGSVPRVLRGAGARRRRGLHPRRPVRLVDRRRSAARAVRRRRRRGRFAASRTPASRVYVGAWQPRLPARRAFRGRHRRRRCCPSASSSTSTARPRCCRTATSCAPATSPTSAIARASAIRRAQRRLLAPALFVRRADRPLAAAQEPQRDRRSSRSRSWTSTPRAVDRRVSRARRRADDPWPYASSRHARRRRRRPRASASCSPTGTTAATTLEVDGATARSRGVEHRRRDDRG